MEKKKILVFGDSNTWGYCPYNKHPFAPFDRWEEELIWPGVMQNALGEEYLVASDGLCGRTASAKDDIEDYTCGKEQIVPSLRSHSPLDLLVIMLGSNDLKARYGYTAYDVANSVGMVVEKALSVRDAFRGCRPRILLICPPPLGNLERSFFSLEFRGREETSATMAPFFELIAEKYGVDYLNAGDFVRFCSADGLHLDREEHQRLGEIAAERVKKILK